MKIAVDVRCLMTAQYSGVSRYTAGLLEALLNLDRDNQYFLFYNSSKKISLPPFERKNARYLGYHWPNKLFNLALNFGNFPKLDRLAGSADLFFAPNLHFVSWSDNCRKILAVHDLSFILFPEFFSWKMRLWHKLIILKKIVFQADLVVADSKNTAKDLEAVLGVDPNKIRVIYPAVDHQRFRVIPKSDTQLEAVRKKYRLPPKFILYLGTLEPRKNIAGVIRAFQRLAPDDCRLVLAGPRGWKTGPLLAEAEKDSRITLTGYFQEEDKPALYNLAEFLIYPSFYEGFGLPLLEALASGCPVIAGANSSQPEVVGQAGLLVNPDNLGEITKAAEALLKDDRLRRRLAEAGIIQARRFSWPAAAKQFLEIFKKYENRN